VRRVWRQLGVIVVYGVDRDDAKAGAERPFGDLCIRSFIMHSSMEYSEIVMSGACSHEGKTFKAVASSKPGKLTRVGIYKLLGAFLFFPFSSLGSPGKWTTSRRACVLLLKFCA